jgi:hypothetical protein
MANHHDIPIQSHENHKITIFHGFTGSMAGGISPVKSTIATGVVWCCGSICHAWTGACGSFPWAPGAISIPDVANQEINSEQPTSSHILFSWSKWLKYVEMDQNGQNLVKINEDQ